jgi:hypothetical protein
MLCVGIFSCGVSNIIFAFIFNKIYTKELLEDGYEPTDEVSRLALVANEFIAS